MIQIVTDWVWGWALSRGTPDPVEEPDGYRIDVGLPEHRVRHVLLEPGSARLRAAGITEPGTWLKVCGSLDRPMDSRWTVSPPEYLMSIELGAHPAVTPPAHYTVDVHSTGDVHDAVVRTTGGEHAATGRVAVRRRAAVIDMVETDPAHRRRGLGRVVMSELSRIASERGAVRAVLVATEAGRALYEQLGWTVESPITAAHFPVQ